MIIIGYIYICTYHTCTLTTSHGLIRAGLFYIFDSTCIAWLSDNSDIIWPRRLDWTSHDFHHVCFTKEQQFASTLTKSNWGRTCAILPQYWSILQNLGPMQFLICFVFVVALFVCDVEINKPGSIKNLWFLYLSLSLCALSHKQAQQPQQWKTCPCCFRLPEISWMTSIPGNNVLHWHVGLFLHDEYHQD